MRAHITSHSFPLHYTILTPPLPSQALPPPSHISPFSFPSQAHRTASNPLILSLSTSLSTLTRIIPYHFASCPVPPDESPPPSPCQPRAPGRQTGTLSHTDTSTSTHPFPSLHISPSLHPSSLSRIPPSSLSSPSPAAPGRVCRSVRGRDRPASS